MTDFLKLAKQVVEIRVAANRLLGTGFCLGSKSAFRKAHPDADPVFNAYLLFQNESGFLIHVWSGDVVLPWGASALAELAREVGRPLFLYRESVVHNETFNGRPFPYASYVASFDQHGVGRMPQQIHGERG